MAGKVHSVPSGTYAAHFGAMPRRALEPQRAERPESIGDYYARTQRCKSPGVWGRIGNESRIHRQAREALAIIDALRAK